MLDLSRSSSRMARGLAGAAFGACLFALSCGPAAVVTAQSSSVADALRALRPGLHELSGIDADVDGDGDVDRLVSADEGVEVPHCVVAFRRSGGWTARALTSLGSDRPDRCLGVVGGHVVIAQQSAGAAEVVQAWALLATTSETRITLSRPVELDAEGAAHFDALSARADGARIAIEVPPAHRAATLTP